MLANLGTAGQYCGNLMWEPSGLVLGSGGPTKGAPATRTHVLGSRSAAHIHRLNPSRTSREHRTCPFISAFRGPTTQMHALKLQGKVQGHACLHQVGGACSLTAGLCPSKAVL